MGNGVSQAAAKVGIGTGSLLNSHPSSEFDGRFARALASRDIDELRTFLAGAKGHPEFDVNRRLYWAAERSEVMPPSNYGGRMNDTDMVQYEAMPLELAIARWPNGAAVRLLLDEYWANWHITEYGTGTMVLKAARLGNTDALVALITHVRRQGGDDAVARMMHGDCHPLMPGRPLSALCNATAWQGNRREAADCVEVLAAEATVDPNSGALPDLAQLSAGTRHRMAAEAERHPGRSASQGPPLVSLAMQWGGNAAAMIRALHRGAQRNKRYGPLQLDVRSPAEPHDLPLSVAARASKGVEVMEALVEIGCSLRCEDYPVVPRPRFAIANDTAHSQLTCHPLLHACQEVQIEKMLPLLLAGMELPPMPEDEEIRDVRRSMVLVTGEGDGGDGGDGGKEDDTEELPDRLFICGHRILRRCFLLTQMTRAELQAIRDDFGQLDRVVETRGRMTKAARRR